MRRDQELSLDIIEKGLRVALFPFQAVIIVGVRWITAEGWRWQSNNFLEKVFALLIVVGLLLSGILTLPLFLFAVALDKLYCLLRKRGKSRITKW